MIQFNVTKTTDPIYPALVKELVDISVSTHFDYNAVARQINLVSQGDLFDFAFSKSKQHALVMQMKARGLIKDEDYTLIITEVGDDESGEEGQKGEERAFITRMSTKEAAIIHSPRGRKPMTADEKAAKATERAQVEASKIAASIAPSAPAAAPAAAAPAAEKAAAKKAPAGKAVDKTPAKGKAAPKK